jgi:hypothetical protein
MPGLSDYDRQSCSSTLSDLIRWPLTQPFRVPADPVRDGAAGLFAVVKTPMDLGTVCKKLLDGQYQTVQQFIDDIHVVCDRATLFSGERSMFRFIATDIKKRIDDQRRDKPISQEDEWQRKLESIVNRLHEHIAMAPPPIVPTLPPHESDK